MPNAQITNPAGAFGAVLTADNQATMVSAVCAAAISNKAIVALSTTEAQIVTAATNQNIPSVVGAAVETGVAGNPIMVAVLGPVYSVLKDTGTNIAQFDRLTISATNTGTLTNVSAATAITQVGDTGKVIAIAMAASVTAATTVDAWFLGR